MKNRLKRSKETKQCRKKEKKKDNEEIQNIIEKDKDSGYKKGSKPKTERRIYSRSEEKENMDKQELRSNAAVIFISNNANLGKWEEGEVTVS
jgi:hypothetical protein